jgi:RNA recognition motif-containing protein
MAKKIFVGNISWNVRDQDLFDAFSKFGKLGEVKVIVDTQTHRSKGFGFVTFEDNNDALTAIAEMNGAELNGRPLRIGEANEKSGKRSEERF